MSLSRFRLYLLRRSARPNKSCQTLVGLDIPDDRCGCAEHDYAEKRYDRPCEDGCSRFGDEQRLRCNGRTGEDQRDREDQSFKQPGLVHFNAIHQGK